jgi:hypothetical protein
MAGALRAGPRERGAVCSPRLPRALTRISSPERTRLSSIEVGGLGMRGLGWARLGLAAMLDWEEQRRIHEEWSDAYGYPG